MTTTLEQLGADIKARLDTIEGQFTEDKLKSIIQDLLGGLPADDPIVRKMRFGGDSSDKLIGSKFSRFGLDVSDIEFLHDLVDSAATAGVARQGVSDALGQAFKDVSEATYMSEEEVKRIDGRAIDNLFSRIPKRGINGVSRDVAWAQAQRAMDTAESGFGSQLVGAQYVRDMWTVARQESKVFSLLDTFEMQDPTVYLPVEVDIPEMIFVGESVANNSSEFPTVKTGSNRVQVDAKKFAMHQMWSGEMEEDSLIPFVPFLRRQAQLGLSHYTDSLVLNGDTTNAAIGNINLDDADPADTKHYLAFDGLRHSALIDNTNNRVDAAGVITIAHFATLRGLMRDETRFVDWGHPASAEDLVFITDLTTADEISMLEELRMYRERFDRPILAGEVGRTLGHPILGSMAMSRTEADGKVSTTPANNVKGQVLAINRRGFKVGWRRRIKVETERLPARDQNRIVYTMRLGFGRFTPTGNVAQLEQAAVLINIGA